MLGYVGQRFGDDEVGGRLDRRRQTLLRNRVDLDGHLRARSKRPERGCEALLSQDGGVDSLCQLAQLLERSGELALGFTEQGGRTVRARTKLGAHELQR